MTLILILKINDMSSMTTNGLQIETTLVYYKRRRFTAQYGTDIGSVVWEDILPPNTELILAIININRTRDHKEQQKKLAIF